MSNDKSFWSSLPGILTAFTGVITAAGSLVAALYSTGIIGGPQDTQPGVDAKRVEETPTTREGTIQKAPIALRSAATTLSNDTVNAMLVKHGFYDKIRNPSGKGVVHQFEPQVIGGAVVVLDHATGLMWQKGGSDPMTLTDVEDYMKRLNGERFAGFNDWRLPTLEEAMSLMEPQAYDGFHIAPVFGRGVTFVWTADRTSDSRGWVLYFYDGYPSPERVDFNAWARAVR